MFDRSTALLYHCSTIPYCTAVLLFHCFTAPFLSCSTVPLLHTVPLFHCSTVPLFHCSISPLFHCSTTPFVVYCDDVSNTMLRLITTRFIYESCAYLITLDGNSHPLKRSESLAHNAPIRVRTRLGALLFAKDSLPSNYGDSPYLEFLSETLPTPQAI